MAELDMDHTVTIRELVHLAHFLRSEHGENDEYDRALLELVTDAAHIPQNDRTIVARAIGIPDYIHRK
jgi:hypothetical protein